MDESDALNKIICIIRITAFVLPCILIQTFLQQLYQAFLTQGLHMDRKSVKNVPAYFLFAFEPLTVLVVVPVMIKLAFPLLTHCGIELTPLKRMGTGMVFGTLSVAVAGVVEMKRNMPIYGTFQQESFDGATVNASRMNIFYQTPQYLFYGFAESLVFSTGSYLLL